MFNLHEKRRQTESSKMSQQIPTSRLGMGFLFVGIILLILGFFFFYVASVNDIEHVTTFHDEVNLNSAGSSHNFTDPIGAVIEHPVKPYTITLQPNDDLNTSFPNDIYQIEPVYIVFWDNVSNEVLKYSPQYGNMLDFRNDGTSKMTIQVYLVRKNTSNIDAEMISIFPTTTTLYHNERPQWFYFSIGVALSSLAVIPIFESKKQA
jgi:hypothetical protein